MIMKLFVIIQKFL